MNLPEIELSLCLTGPYSLMSGSQHTLINEVGPSLGGIYVWAVPVNGVYYPHYVGHTHCFVERLIRHLIDLRLGREYYYDTSELANGSFGDGRSPGSAEPFSQAEADEYVRFVRFYLASDPQFKEERLRERVELALARRLDESIYQKPGVPQVWDWTCSSHHRANGPRTGEPNVRFRIVSSAGLAMMPGEPLEA